MLRTSSLTQPSCLQHRQIDGAALGTKRYESARWSRLGAMAVSPSAWGVRFLDYDNDGWKDLLIAQGWDLDTIELLFEPPPPRTNVTRSQHWTRLCGCLARVKQRFSIALYRARDGNRRSGQQRLCNPSNFPQVRNAARGRVCFSGTL